jgi:hypothetical protein
LRLNTFFFGLGLASELQTLKIATDLTNSQIFTFVVDAKSKQKSKIVELELNST